MSLYSDLQQRTCRNRSAGGANPPHESSGLIEALRDRSAKDFAKDLGLPTHSRRTVNTESVTKRVKGLCQRTQKIVLQYTDLSLAEFEGFLTKDDFLETEADHILDTEGFGRRIWGRPADGSIGNRGDGKPLCWKNEADKAIIKLRLRCWMASRIIKEVCAHAERKPVERIDQNSLPVSSLPSTIPNIDGTNEQEFKKETSRLAVSPQSSANRQVGRVTYESVHARDIKKEEQTPDVEIYCGKVLEQGSDNSDAVSSTKSHLKRKRLASATSGSNKQPRIKIPSQAPSTDPPFFDDFLFVEENAAGRVEASQTCSQPLTTLRSCLKKRRFSEQSQDNGLNQAHFENGNQKVDDIQCPSSQPQLDLGNSQCHSSRWSLIDNCSSSQSSLVPSTPDPQEPFTNSTTTRPEPSDTSITLNHITPATEEITTATTPTLKQAPSSKSPTTTLNTDAIRETQKQLKTRLTFILGSELPYSAVTTQIYPLAMRLVRHRMEAMSSSSVPCPSTSSTLSLRHEHGMPAEETETDADNDTSGALQTWKGIIDKLEKYGGPAGYTGSPLTCPSTCTSTIPTYSPSHILPHHSHQTHPSHTQKQSRKHRKLSAQTKQALVSWAKTKKLQHVLGSPEALRGWCGDLAAFFGELLGEEGCGDGGSGSGGELVRLLVGYNWGLAGWFGFRFGVGTGNGTGTGCDGYGYGGKEVGMEEEGNADIGKWGRENG